jgi:diaminopimelate decarboxylase
MFNAQNLEKLKERKTPFFYYNLNLLKETLLTAKRESEKYGYFIHYAVKANANNRILNTIRSFGYGADCVSGNEIRKSLENGFSANGIVYAGVGKSDEELELAVEMEIFCINCESLEELSVLNKIAEKKYKKPRVAIRINPNVNAKTHKYISTALNNSKFGIGAHEFPALLELLPHLKNLDISGLHFHVGSQITDLNVFSGLCEEINKTVNYFRNFGITFSHLNVGGGLGVDYLLPDDNKIPDFAGYFAIFNRNLQKEPKQTVHFELGRSLVAQCGSLITKVLYNKQGNKSQFAIVDAGMTELIRPALYQAYHKIQNLSSKEPKQYYDIVGPICESADCFGSNICLNAVTRSNLLAIRTTGAYGEVMTSQYNLRDKAGCLYSDELESNYSCQVEIC